MKTSITVTFIFLFLFLTAYQQKYTYPDFQDKNLSQVLKNTGWTLLKEAEGDLNKDGKADKAIIIESKDSIIEKRCNSCKSLKSKARIILVLINNNGALKVISQNNKFIARGDEGAMLTYLEPELTIENNLLHIFYQYTRSNQTYTFSYENEEVKIAEAKSAGVQASTGNYAEETYDFKKGIITIKTGHISKDPITDKVKTIQFPALSKTLDEMEEMGSWEVVENYWL